MAALGIRLTLLIGESVPSPISQELVEAFQSLEVTHNDQGRSGFQLVFRVGRRDRNDMKDYRLVSNPLFSVFNRVVVVVTIGASAQVLMDGVITHQQLTPSMQIGQSTFTLTGEDISVMMDLHERSDHHTGQDEATIARVILNRYTKYGIIPDVKQPDHKDQPTKNQRIPSQQGTDLNYLRQIGERFSFVFYLTPGPKVGFSTAYWGPPLKTTEPQKALTVNMGSYSNVDSISFQNSATAATIVEGFVQDRETNKKRPIIVKSSTRPPLSSRPALNIQKAHLIRQFRETARTTSQSQERAKARTNKSVDDVISVNGELDTIRYGELLKLRGLVGLRGVGDSYGGLYYVKSVTHTLSAGEYKQKFTITREGLGSTVQKVSI